MRDREPNPEADPWDAERAAKTPEVALEAALMVAFGSGASNSEQGLVGSVSATILPDIPTASDPGGELNPERLNRATRRYRIQSELARGGLGRIFLAKDLDLGREVALKLLREDLIERGSAVRRLVEEAQVSGQLQHPGIVPIYEVGWLGPERPFIAMKLIRGSTLADLLASRQSPEQDRPRFLDIFGKICEAMAFAHSRSVIHRDLKPSNVMVGSFGEVQVMDWGLAKVVTTDDKDVLATEAESQITTVRSGRIGLDSVEGSVLGTPAYMAPEQARGENDSVGKPADVFALGAILCEILTGERPYGSGSRENLQRRAANGGILDSIASRLQNQASPLGIEQLALRSLSIAISDRPKDAGAVLAEFEEWTRSTSERARKAELAAAESRARAGEERRSRRLTVMLAAAIVTTLFVVLGGILWYESRRRDRERETAEVLAAAVAESQHLLAAAENSAPNDLPSWEAALAAARRAEAVARSGEATQATRTAVNTFRAHVGTKRDLAHAHALELKRDQELMRRLDIVRSDIAFRGHFSRDATPAFLDYGIDLLQGEPTEVVECIRTSRIRNYLLATIDSWALDLRGSFGREHADYLRLQQLLLRVDDDPLRMKIRQALESADRATLSKIARDPEASTLPEFTHQLLAGSLSALGARPEACELLERAWPHAPTSYWILMDLGYNYTRSQKLQEATRAYTAALALRPQSYSAWSNLGAVLDEQGRLPEALQCLKRAIACHDGAASVHSNLAGVHYRMRETALAVASYEKAIELDPELSPALQGLAIVHESLGEFQKAEPYARRAVESAPRSSKNLSTLANVLLQLGRADEAQIEFEKAVALDPTNVHALMNLGGLSHDRRDLNSAEQYFQRAVSLDPASPSPYLSLADVLQRRRHLDPTIPLLERAERLDPTSSHPTRLLAVTHRLRHDLPASKLAFERALEKDPDSAESLSGLASVLELLGQPKKALELVERSRTSTSRRPRFRDQSEEMIARLKKMIALESRLDEFRSKASVPSGDTDCILVARLLAANGFLADATHYYREVLDLPPIFRAQLNDGLRLEGARVAARAAGSEYDADPGEAQRSSFRHSALTWFDRELDLIERRRDPDREPNHCELLRAWIIDPDLAPFRAPASARLLPEAERQAWAKAFARAQSLKSELEEALSR